MSNKDMEELVGRCGGRLFRLAAAVLGGAGEAEDAVQEVFVKYIEKRPRFESREHEEAWLTRVTVNHCKNMLRSRSRRPTVPLLESFQAQTEDERDCVELVAALPPKYRAVIHLLYYEGRTVKDTARIIGVSEPAVRKRHSRACAMLKTVLEGEFA